MKSFKTVSVAYFGHEIPLPDIPKYSKFYGKLSSGTWEPNTFSVLGRNLNRNTVYVDIGAWIGVTPFWATHHAKSVIAVEPDPACVEVLNNLSSNYSNLRILHGALSNNAKIQINAVDGFGSSASTILNIGNGESTVVRGYNIHSILNTINHEPIFVKIDIEGYEYHLGDEIKKLENYDLRGLQLAVHPRLYEKSRRTYFPFNRVGTVIQTWKLGNLESFFKSPLKHQLFLDTNHC